MQPPDLQRWNDVAPIRRLTYDNPAEKATYEQAAQNTGYDVRVVEEGPIIAIWTYDERADLTPFWREFERIQAVADATA